MLELSDLGSRPARLDTALLVSNQNLVVELRGECVEIFNGGTTFVAGEVLTRSSARTSQASR